MRLQNTEPSAPAQPSRGITPLSCHQHDFPRTPAQTPHGSRPWEKAKTSLAWYRVSWGCWNELPQTGWLKITEMSSIAILEVRNPNTVSQGQTRGVSGIVLHLESPGESVASPTCLTFLGWWPLPPFAEAEASAFCVKSPSASLPKGHLQ